MSEIQSLTARAQDLERSFNAWNAWYVGCVFVAVVIATAVFFTQFMSIRRGKQLAAAQSALLLAKDASVAGELKDKDLKIADALKAAGLANERAGLANERAGSLESANLHLRADLEHATAESRSKQAALEIEQRKTVEAQLALRKAAEYIATPRRIIMDTRIVNGYNDHELRVAAFKKLEKYADTPAVILYIQEEEAQILAGDIRTALIQAGWKSLPVLSLASTSIPPGFVMEGVQIRTWLGEPDAPYFPPPNAIQPSVVTALIDLLKLDLNPPMGSPLGVRWEPEGMIHGKHLTGLAGYGFTFPKNGVVISVGRKPTEQLFWGIPDLPVKSK